MPLSSFAETLRSAKVEVDLQINAGRKVIGIVSVMPGEGKTTTAKNLASLIALQGARVLLIDADFRNPGMTRRMAPCYGRVDRGTSERTATGGTFCCGAGKRILFLPSVTKKRILDSQVLLASNEMEKLLEEAAANFDYVIVDLPPLLGPVIDVRGISRFFNATFVFVVEWGTTPPPCRSASAGRKQGISTKKPLA